MHGLSKLRIVFFLYDFKGPYIRRNALVVVATAFFLWFCHFVILCLGAKLLRQSTLLCWYNLLEELLMVYQCNLTLPLVLLATI